MQLPKFQNQNPLPIFAAKQHTDYLRLLTEYLALTGQRMKENFYKINTFANSRKFAKICEFKRHFFSREKQFRERPKCNKKMEVCAHYATS